MRERRVEILRNLLAAQGFLPVADLMATDLSVASGHRGAPPCSLAVRCEAGVQTLVVDPEARVTVTA
jgi:hypothetical protein